MYFADNNVPFNKIAGWFSCLGKYLIIEFVPKNDSQVELLNEEKTIREIARIVSGEITEIFKIESSETELTFGEYKISEWEKMVKHFYETHGDYVPDKVVCHYIEQGDFVADIYTDEEITDQYIFDNKTFIAVNESGLYLDFVKGERTDSKVMFYDNECLAIGYVLNEDLEEFKEKYLKRKH